MAEATKNPFEGTGLYLKGVVTSSFVSKKGSPMLSVVAGKTMYTVMVPKANQHAIGSVYEGFIDPFESITVKQAA